MPQYSVITLDRSYIDFSPLKFETSQAEAMAAPEIAFNEIKVPVAVKVAAVAQPRVQKIVTVKKTVEVKPAVLVVAKPEKAELPFQEPVVLSKIEFNNELITNHLAYFEDVKVEESAVAVVEDKVETKQAVAATSKKNVAADEDLDGLFFEYPTEAPKKAEEVAAPKITAENLKQIQVEEKSAVSPDVTEEVMMDELFAESAPVQDAPVNAMTTQAQVAPSSKAEAKATPAPTLITGANLGTSSVAAANPPLTMFDYSSAKKAVKDNKIPTVSAVTTQPNKQEVKAITKSALKMKTVSYASKTNIQVTSTDLKAPALQANFEVRFMDDQSIALSDYGSGTVVLEDSLAAPRMTRATTVLKRGFAPTNNDLIIEEGESTLSLPVIEQDTFNELQRPFESRGSVGAVLVELDDKTEDVTIDVPFGRFITLDGDLKFTKENDFRYKLFVGVRAGNALLSYKMNRQSTSRIIHVHEHEVTFDANIYEAVDQIKVSLKEEELLSKEKSSLITTADRVRLFATDKSAKKINDHLYSLDFGKGLLGSRQYIELNHQTEPVFVGVKDNKNVSVPSESFMRHVIQTIEGGNLSHHCVVQVNLTKKLDKMIVGGESVNESLVTYSQALDSDGKFYDSPSEKTRKLIIVGENQGSEETSQDGKINVKLNYVDGTSEYLGSYCSPNTYLVEQL